jgi:hypothetical protein
MLIASLVLYLHGGMRVLFVFATIVLIIHFCYSWLFLPKSQKLPIRRQHNLTKALPTLGEIKGQLAALILLMVAFAVIYEAVRPLWQPHMQQIGINIASFGIIFALLKLASILGSFLASRREFKSKEIIIIFSVMLVALLIFGTSKPVISVSALFVFLCTENYFRVYMSTIMNEAITSNRAALLSLGSVIRNSAGAIIVLGAGMLSQISVFVALAVVVALKIPAMMYIIMKHRQSVR